LAKWFMQDVLPTSPDMFFRLVPPSIRKIAAGRHTPAYDHQ
jgi:hypothetical protein